MNDENVIFNSLLYANKKEMCPTLYFCFVYD